MNLINPSSRCRSPGCLLAGVLLWALVLLAAPQSSRAEPDAVLGMVPVSGAALRAVYAHGTGINQILVVADETASRLRFVSLPSLLEVGMPFDLLTGCAPRALQEEGGRLYVACGGTGVIDIVDLSALSASNLVVTRPGCCAAGIAVGSGPDGLLQIQSGLLNYLIVENATDKTATVIDISTPDSPVVIDTDASAGNGTTPVRLCGTDPLAANRSAPVGLGAGTEFVHVACMDGTISHFNPFAGGDYSQSASEDLGLPAIFRGAGRPGVHGFFIQTAGTPSSLAVLDVSQVELGGASVVQQLYTSMYLVTGPAAPRGILPFTDSATGLNWVALAGDNPASVQLFNIDDLGMPGYTPPASRTAVHIFSTGVASFAGSGREQMFAANGYLHLPSGGASLTIFTGAPVLTFTSPTPLAMSSLADPGLSTCAPMLPLPPLDVPWSASKNTASCTAYLSKSTDSQYPLAGCTSSGTTGIASIDAGDVADIVGLSEEMLVRVLPVDSPGNEGIFEEIVLADGTRPDEPTGVSASIVQGVVYVSWLPAIDQGTPLASGTAGYVVEIVKNPGNMSLSTQSTTERQVSYTLAAPLAAGDTVEARVATCDAAGNRSAAFSPTVIAVAGSLGAAGVTGEAGGCVLGANGSLSDTLPGVFLWAMALLIAGAFRRRWCGGAA